MTQQALLNDFNAALASQQINPLAADAFTMVLQARGEKQVRNLVNMANTGSTDAATTLKQVAQKVRLAWRLRALGFTVAYDQASTILATVAPDDVAAAIKASLSGDKNAAKVLGEWVAAATAANNGSNAPARSSAEIGGPSSRANQQSAPSSGYARSPVPQRPPSPQRNASTMRSMAPPPNHPTGQARVSSHVDNHRVAPQTPNSRPAEERQEYAPEPERRSAVASTREYENAVAYGARAALTFSADTTKRKEQPTVRVEAAVAGNGREYDWDNKLSLQFTCEEMQLVAGLFAGFVQELRFANHGAANDKWINIVRQDNVVGYQGTIKFTLGQGKAEKFKPRTVLVDYASMGQIYALLLRQCKRHLRLDEPCTLAAIRQVTQCYAAQKAGKPQNQQQG